MSNIMEEIYAKAKKDVQIVAFPEVEEEKIWQAAKQCLDEGICKPMMVGKMEDIEKYSKEYGISLDGFLIKDAGDEALLEDLGERYSKINPEMSAKAVKRKAKDPMYVALFLQAVGEAAAERMWLSVKHSPAMWSSRCTRGSAARYCPGSRKD